MQLKVFLFLTTLIASCNAFASGELATEYSDRRITEVCAGANKTVTLIDLESMLQQSAKNGACGIYRVTRFYSPSAAKAPTLDGYNGAILSISLIGDALETDNISASTVRLRDIKICALEDGSRVSIAYGLSTSEPARFENPVGNFLYQTFVSQPQALDRRVVFEFESGQLRFASINDYYIGMSTAEHQMFQCGHASYAK